MFHQLLTPVGGSLALSFIVAAVPVIVVLVMLGILQRPAWQASLAGLAAGLIIAIAFWSFPPAMAFNAAAAGMVFAVWPVMWIVFAALLLYNVAVVSGRFDAFRDWVFQHLPGDRRVVLIVIGFCFGALLEGVSGFGTPIAITSSLLILTGWPAIEALTYTLIFNTAPVAFGALGVPVTVLAKVTSLPAGTLAAMIGRQLPFFALLLPFYVMFVYGGRRSIASLWPLLLVAGGSFAVFQFGTSNFGDYQLTDVFSSLGSLIITILFLRVWKPAHSEEFAVVRVPTSIAAGRKRINVWQGWLPWLIVSVVVILWTHYKVPLNFAQDIHWPGLDNQVFITLYNKPYALVWTFQPLASGTAILIAGMITSAAVGVGAGRVRHVRRAHGEAGVDRGSDSRPDHWARLPDELLRHDLHARQRRRFAGPALPARLRVPRLGCGHAVRLRHVRQRAVRQSTGCRGTSAEPEPGAVRRHQLVRWRHGQDDLAAEHRDRCRGD